MSLLNRNLFTATQAQQKELHSSVFLRNLTRGGLVLTAVAAVGGAGVEGYLLTHNQAWNIPVALGEIANAGLAAGLVAVHRRISRNVDYNALALWELASAYQRDERERTF